MKTNTIVNRVIAIAIILFIIAMFIAPKPESKQYKVEITYCDTRPKKIVYVNSIYMPSNKQIRTYKRAVPEWNDELNVCEIRVIK